MNKISGILTSGMIGNFKKGFERTPGDDFAHEDRGSKRGFEELIGDDYVNNEFADEIEVRIFKGAACETCPAAVSELKNIIGEFEGKVTMREMDADAPGIKEQYSIRVLPTYIIFKNAAPLKLLEGKQPYEYLKNQIGEFL